MSRGDASASARASVWIAVVAASSVIFSLALACATPFAALATIAGTRTARGPALATIAVAWLANQAVGYLVLGYPRTWDSFAWGAAIGAAAILATVAVLAIRYRGGSLPTATAVGFATAFLVYEGALFASTAVLPSGPGAFAPQVVLQILWTNVLALAGLLLLHRLATAIGLPPPATPAALPVRG